MPFLRIQFDSYLCRLFISYFMHFNKSILFPIFLLVVVVSLVFTSCKKDNIDTDPSVKLSFSNDSIIFDTVFTSLGSATYKLMVYNTSNNNISISSVQLNGGPSSPYRINLDGVAGYQFSDIDIAANDSLFLFARVTIDPNNTNNPFVVEDSLSFITNGNEQKIKLVAWGQNANYILADTYTPGFPAYKVVADSLQTVTWTSEKPYVIYGYAVINSYGKLIIEEGTKVYFHKGGGLWAYTDGVLKVMGTRENNIIFRNDRFGSFYDTVPGQWDRIWLMEGRTGENHEIYNAVIENGFIGVQAESFLRPTENELIMENVIIRNMNGLGIFSRLFNIKGSNLVISNCGGYCLGLTLGGNYSFKQSTIADYWSEKTIRRTPAVYLNNFATDNTLGTPIPFPMNFYFENGIIYGYNQNEFDTDMDGGADSLYYLTNCILRTTRSVSNPANFNKILKNKNPLFVNKVNDYQLDSLSPAVGYGDPEIAITVPFDILGNPRLPLPDLGAYQFVPGQGGRKYFFK